MTTMRKRPRDFSQAAKLVVDIASGQVEDRKMLNRIFGIHTSPKRPQNRIQGFSITPVGWNGDFSKRPNFQGLKAVTTLGRAAAGP